MRVFVFSVFCDKMSLYIGLALTEHGGWVAGTVSHSPGEATNRVSGQVEIKDPTANIIPSDFNDQQVQEALAKALRRRP